MTDTTFTFRVDETLKDAFSTAAKACDRTVAQLLRDFMRDYVQQQSAATGHNKPPRRQKQGSAKTGKRTPANRLETALPAPRRRVQVK